MPWLKKNLLLVLGGLIALGLLGFAGFFLYSQIQKDLAVTENLAQQSQNLDELKNLNPHPGTEKINNIEAAKKQDQELQDFLKRAVVRFTAPAYPTNLDGGQLRLRMDDTIDELQRAAKQFGVKLRQNYAFGFAAQRTTIAFEQKDIQPLAMMLMDIKSIASILFECKIQALDQIRRPSLASQDTPVAGASTGGPSDYWSKKPTTNDLAIITPYEFTFHCFTPELVGALDKLSKSSNSFIVKNIIVDTTPSPLLDKDAAAAEGDGSSQVATIPGMPPGMSASTFAMMLRYGRMPGRYGNVMMPPPVPQPDSGAPTPGATGPGGTTTMLDEKPFRVVLWVYVVRIKEPTGPKEATETGGRRTARDRQSGAQPGDSATPASANNQPAQQ